MDSKWIIAGVFIFVIMTLLAGVVEGASINEGTTTFQDLLNPSLSSEYYNTLKTVFTFDYPFFTGGWEILRWVVFLPLGIGVSISIVTAFGSFIRSLLGR